MGHMLGREKTTGKRTGHNKYGLVIPAVIHDGQDFPSSLDYIQRMDIKSCYNTRILKNSKKAAKLSDLIDDHAEGIAVAIRTAPEWDCNWPREAADAFFSEFYKAEEPNQTEVPKFQPQ